jgi:hypothetical protein
MDILRRGHHVEVLYPETLRQAVKAKRVLAAEIYI